MKTQNGIYCFDDKLKSSPAFLRFQASEGDETLAMGLLISLWQAAEDYHELRGGGIPSYVYDGMPWAHTAVEAGLAEIREEEFWPIENEWVRFVPGSQDKECRWLPCQAD